MVGSLFDLDDLVHLLLTANDSVQVSGGTAIQGRTSSVSPQPQRRKGAISDFFRNSTIALSAVETLLPRLAAWSRAFARAFGVTSEVNLYLTPAGAQAFSVHNDRQDVLAAQINGNKSWSVWDLDGLELSPELAIEPVAAPFRHTVSLLSKDAAPLERFPAPTLDPELSPGALLYVPRGSLHVASTATSSVSSSLHLTIGVLTQSFSYAIAVFHLAAEPSFRENITKMGWDLHRFRQNLMRLADQKQEGIPFRTSLPLGWTLRAKGLEATSACPLDKGITVDHGRRMIDNLKVTLAGLAERVFKEAPQKPGQETIQHQVEISDDMLGAVADIFFRHLDKFEKDVAAVVDLPRSAHTDAIELPAGLHVAYVASGIEGPGTGELDVRFSWCGRGYDGAAEARWPAAVLPMLQTVSASVSRVVPLTSFSDAEDLIPKIVFAVELAQIPLDPPIKLVASSRRERMQRNPDCESTAGSEL